MNDWTDLLPPMLAGETLNNRLACYPKYDPEIRNGNASERLLGLSSLYDVYIPGTLSVEVYSKLYLATHRSLQKKQDKKTVTLQLVENRKRLQHADSNGIIGGADSFTVIGQSGIGKSSAISRAVQMISEKGIIETNAPYAKIIPCVSVQTPFDASVRSMLLEILRVVDERLLTNYHQSALRARATTDMLISSVSSVALNHIGTLIVDEIQNVANSRNGDALVGALTQLINSSGISICMVGTPDSASFFQQAYRLARRSLGIEGEPMQYDDVFKAFCRTLIEYCYVQNEPELSEGILAWLYEHSGGVASVIISLLHDAQELAIYNGRETLDQQALELAYKQRMRMLHGYIDAGRIKPSTTSIIHTKRDTLPQQVTNVDDPHLMKKALERARSSRLSIMQILRENGVAVMEIPV